MTLNSSLSHTDNRKNNFSVLGEGLTDNINGSVVAAEKRQSCTWVCIIMVIVVICSLTKKFYRFKADNKNVDCFTHFCLGV